VLVNPHADRLASLPLPFRTRVELSRTLLRHSAQGSGVSVRLLGDVDQAAPSFQSLPNCQILSGDPMSFWRDSRASRRLGPPDAQVIYLGGAWLDQQVLAAALSAVHIGYDTRMLVDVSIAHAVRSSVGAGAAGATWRADDHRAADHDGMVVGRAGRNALPSAA
jgi:hypothetical protein